MDHRGLAVLACLIGAMVATSGAATAAPQRLALVVAHVVDGRGEPVEGVEVRLIRCRGARRFTQMPSFELANPSGVPLEADRDNCDVLTANTGADGTASFPSVRVGDSRLEAARDSTLAYLVRVEKTGYTPARRLVIPHVARNDFEFVVYRTVGERMFELIDEAKAAVGEGGFAAAEAAMIQAVAMMSAVGLCKAEPAYTWETLPPLVLDAARHLDPALPTMTTVNIFRGVREKRAGRDKTSNDITRS